MKRVFVNLYQITRQEDEDFTYDLMECVDSIPTLEENAEYLAYIFWKGYKSKYDRLEVRVEDKPAKRDGWMK